MGAGLRRAFASVKKPTERQIALLSAIAQTPHGACMYGDFDPAAKGVVTRMKDMGWVNIIGLTVYITKAGRSKLDRIYQ